MRYINTRLLLLLLLLLLFRLRDYAIVRVSISPCTACLSDCLSVGPSVFVGRIIRQVVDDFDENFPGR